MSSTPATDFSAYPAGLGNFLTTEFHFQTSYSAGYTSNSRTKEVKMPPTIGAAIRFITSEPAPVAHMMGQRPTQVVAKVMNFGRRRLAAP